MEDLKKYVPNSIFKSIKTSSQQQTLKKIKIKYLEQIVRRMGGLKFLNLYAKELKLKRFEDSIVFSEYLSLSQVYQLIVNYFTCAKTHFVLICDGYNVETVEENISQYQNEYGLPIWSKSLESIPTLWNVISEKVKGHYCLTYIHSNPKNTFYDPIIHDVRTYEITGIINFRIHLDHSIFIEVYNSNTTIDKIKQGIINLKKILNIKEINFLEITQHHIQTFDNVADKITHEAREGEEATVYLTRVNESKDTRRDSLRIDFGLEDRDFRLEHGIIKLENVNYIVGLKKGRRGRIRILRHLPSSEQIHLMHKLYEILGWIS